MLLESLASSLSESREDEGELPVLPAGISGTKRYYVAYQHRGIYERRGFLKDDWNGYEAFEIMEARNQVEPSYHWWLVEAPRYTPSEQTTQKWVM